jgi:hypothetical protein
MFYNFTTEDFKTTWDEQPYTFKSGQVYEKLAIASDGVHNVELTETVCRVFAHHLANKVLNTPSLDVNFTVDKANNAIPTDLAQMRVHNLTNLEKLIERAMTAPDIEVVLPEALSELPLVSGVPEEVEVVVPKKSPGRPKKVQKVEVTDVEPEVVA